MREARKERCGVRVVVLVLVVAAMAGCEMRWHESQFPLPLVVSSELRECWKREVQNAQARLNGLVIERGAPVRVFALQWEGGHVERTVGAVVVRQADTGNRAGVARLRRGAGGIESVVVELHEDGCQRNTASHELGHALGLGHVAGRENVMHAPSGHLWGEWSISYIVGQML